MYYLYRPKGLDKEGQGFSVFVQNIYYIFSKQKGKCWRASSVGYYWQRISKRFSTSHSQSYAKPYSFWLFVRLYHLSVVCHSLRRSSRLNSLLRFFYRVQKSNAQKHAPVLVLSRPSPTTISHLYMLHIFHQFLPCLYAVFPTGYYACLSRNTLILFSLLCACMLSIWSSSDCYCCYEACRTSLNIGGTGCILKFLSLCTPSNYAEASCTGLR